jgi:hypothetical protein
MAITQYTKYQITTSVCMQIDKGVNKLISYISYYSSWIKYKLGYSTKCGSRKGLKSGTVSTIYNSEDNGSTQDEQGDCYAMSYHLMI